MHINVTFHDPETARRLDQIETALLSIGRNIMATLKDIQDDVTAEKTVIDSAVALLAGLSQQLKDAIAANDPAALQAIVDGLDANKAELAAAVTANTPAAPTP
jgi:uncharacterized protein YoxC